jgi:hypothetical protein
LSLALAALAVFAVAPRSAEAGEIQLEGAALASASTWRGDYGGGGQLRLGYRFARVFAIDFAGSEQYLSVDHRLDTGLTLGLSGYLPLGRVRPLLRLYFIHQHEEALVSVEEHPFGTVFGIGDGIRHRAGGGGSLGVEVAFAKSAHVDWVAVGGTSVTVFPDATLGPGAYFGLFAGVGLAYQIPGLP